MISLQADNRILTSSSKYSYLLANYVSGTTNLTILNATDSVFAANAYLLFGQFGSETAEICQISTVNNTTGAIVLVAATKFAHSESTRVTVLAFNQIRFFWTAIEVFNTATPLTGFVNLQPSDWFSTYDDSAHPTGFGWYTYYNSTTTISSQQSNSLPYAGFGHNSVEDVLNSFFSMLNNKELKLVTRQDAISWLDEGVSKITNRLNLSNREFTSSALQTLTTQPNVYEYLLPSDFYQLLSIQLFIDPANPVPPTTPGGFWDNSVDYISLREAFSSPNMANFPRQRYYIRGKYLGLVPAPITQITYSYMYLAKSTSVNDNSSVLNLPDNGEFIVKDWMLFRAHSKFGNSQAASDFKNFQDGLNDLVVSAIDRDANLDECGIINEACV